MPALAARFQWGFAKMEHCRLQKIVIGFCVRNCVRGGQGSPRVPIRKCGPLTTPGSSMNRRVARQAALGAESFRAGRFGYFFSGLAIRIALFAVLAVAS